MASKPVSSSLRVEGGIIRTMFQGQADPESEAVRQNQPVDTSKAKKHQCGLSQVAAAAIVSVL